MLDPRIDPRNKTNPNDFWIGYGRYQEGVNYKEIPKGDDFLAGWCFGLSEGEQVKPWWKSKLLWLGIAAMGIAFLGMINPEMIKDNPRIAAFVAILVGTLTAGLRMVTKVSIK